MTAETPELLAAVAARLTGHLLRWEGSAWELLETLTDGPVPVLVLRAADGRRGIQANQHGEAARRVPTLLELPLLDEDGALHPEILALFEENALAPP